MILPATVETRKNGILTLRPRLSMAHTPSSTTANKESDTLVEFSRRSDTPTSGPTETGDTYQRKDRELSVR